MGPDSPLSAALAHRLPATGGPRHQGERRALFADVLDLELRLAIIDARFDRLAGRPEDAFQDWRRDTVAKVHAIAARARLLEDANDLEPHHRRRVAALLLTVRHRLGALDARHAAFGGRRAKRARIGRTDAAAPPYRAESGRADLSGGPA